MIACVDSEKDITVYLTDKEVDDISNRVVEGVLVRLHRPKQQGKLYISVNNERKNENESGFIGGWEC